MSLAAPLVAASLLALAREAVDPANAALVLVLLVVAAAATGRRAAGVGAAVSSAVCFDFFLTEPYLRLTIADRDDVETAVLLVLVGLAVTEIALWGRRQQADASRRLGHLDGLVSATGMAAGGAVPAASVVDLVGEQVRRLTRADSVVFRDGPPGAHPRIGRDGGVSQGGRDLAVDRSGLPTHDVVELPVTSGGRTHGRYVLHTVSEVVWPSAEELRVAVALADQAGAALAGSPR